MDQIPVEIWTKILSYLSSYDLIQFCTAFENYNYFLKEQSLVRFINFSRKFELQEFALYKFITTSVNYTSIKILNIDYLYWISSEEIRRLVLRLENLEALHAVDTKIRITEEDVFTYAKLKKLAISVGHHSFPEFSNVLKSLYLKIIVKDCCFHNDIYQFFEQMNHLEELWICNDNKSYKINYDHIANSLNNLEKFVIKSNTSLPLYDFMYLGLFKVFECRRYGSSTEYIFEKILNKPEGPKRSIFEPRDNEIEKSWEVFYNLHKDLPCGPVESKKIYLKQDIKDIEFEDLNFCQAVKLCNSKYINAALQILSSKNSTNLKRLSFRSCLFQSPQLKPRVSMTTGFKRLRSGIQFNSTDHPFKNIAHNIRKLRELEVVTCSSCSGGTKMSAYHLIDTFEGLQKLTLEIPIILDGSFLKEVFTKCRYLQSLNLNCLGHNEKFIINLCRNLQYANELRDFRLEHKEIAIDKLLNSFNTIVSKKLLRIFIKCDSLRNSNDEVFSDCLGKNPQLIFFYLIVSNNSINSLGIRKILSSYKKGHPAKNFFVVRDASTFNGVFPIPAAHHDMIFPRTNVSVINLDDF